MALIVSNTLTIDDNGWVGYSLRIALKLSGGALDQVRVRLYASNTGIATINNTAIGISITSDPTDGTAVLGSTLAQVPLLWLGLASKTIAAGGNAWTDWANLSGFTSSNYLIVTTDFGGSNANPRAVTGLLNISSGGPGGTIYKAATASYNIADMTAAVGFNGLNAQITFVGEIETQSTASGSPKLIGGQLLNSPLLAGKLLR